MRRAGDGVILTIDRLRPGDRHPGPAILALGFRPFFFLGALWASGAIVLWAHVLHGGAPAPTPFDPASWHAREMLFGFALAIVAGFLLTAPGNWTGAR